MYASLYTYQVREYANKLSFQKCQRKPISASEVCSNWRTRQEANTLFCLPCSLWTAASSHNCEQQNLLTTKYLFNQDQRFLHTLDKLSQKFIFINTTWQNLQQQHILMWEN